LKEYAEALLTTCRVDGFVVHQQEIPGEEARHGDLPFSPAPPVAAALRRAGIERLYSHQAEAVGHAMAGRPVLVVTPTASGKSLVYNLPVLEGALRAPGARALYLFPYKALEQDQKTAFEALAAAFPPESRPRCAIYDGDTPPGQRRKIKADPPQVLITNPDMLHLGLLAHHGDWSRFFAGLRTVVVDELHIYRGVFGTHLHHIVQRLRRLCDLYGSRPAFIAASATVGEPGRLGRELLGDDFQVVDRSGAPRAARRLVFLRPGLQVSPYTVATRLMGRALGDGRRTITFTKARRITELIHSWLVASQPALRTRVASYRAGYLPSERRAIEADLASGRLLGVVSTSALELGVDIGGLDVCILVGYPGSITSSWQRIGRVGRQDRDSLVLLVGMPDALDQYFLSHPREFFSRPFEPVVFDPGNRAIASAHLICAGAELPLSPRDEARYGPEVFGLVRGLVQEGKLMRDAGEERWYSLRRRPQRQVNLRSIGETFQIEDTGGRPMGTVDALRARAECHTGAIYLHGGRSFRIRALDLDRRRVTAEPAFDADYFTVVLTEKETEILERRETADHGPFRAGFGRLKVTTWFRGYLRKRLLDQTTLSEHELDLPPAQFETDGLWVELPPGLAGAVAARQGHFMGAIHATEHAAIGLFPLLALCDRSDLGGISYPEHPQVGGPAVFIYDGRAGGIGLAAEGFRRVAELLSRTRDLIRACPCEDGCPSCIQSPRCGNGNRPLDKAMAVFLLDIVSGREELPAPPPRAVAPPRRVPSTPPEPISPPVPGPGVAPRPAAAPPDRAPSSPRNSALSPPPDLFFDVETLRSAADVGGWERANAMGLALAVTYDRGGDRWRTYREAEARELIISLLSARRVVGFNVKRFDYAVLSGYAEADFSRVQTLDLLEEVHKVLGFRLSLAHLAETTLGVAKSGDGLQSLSWVREGRWDLVEAYCRRDVELTVRLFDFGRQRGHLLFRDREGRLLRLPVSWA
jgi:DEAD/DEAH box helicase domain-containing protein